MRITVSGLWRYPVKSTRGEALQSATVEPWGLAGDRRWLIVDEGGKAVTAREHPRLVLVEARSEGTGRLSLRAPGMTGTVAIANGPLEEVTVWSSTVSATPAPQSAAWLSEYLDKPVRLFYLDDPTRRPTNPLYSREDDRVSFADGYPVLLTNEASLARLNDWIAEGPNSAQGPLPIQRFRPNIVITGAEPFEEDSWRRLRIGPVTWRAVKSCDRCVLTTVDPQTAAKGKEPVATLARHRRWDGKIWFGVNLIPDLRPDETGELSVGDELTVLRAVESREPQRVG